MDAVVCDPPYGLGKQPAAADVMRAWLDGEQVQTSGGGFMGHAWDAFVPAPVLWEEVHRVLKPGGHAIAFAGTRTVHWMGLAMQVGGLEARDVLHWCYWSGFAKGPDLGKLFDRRAGAERTEQVGIGHHYGTGGGAGRTTDLAKRWDGWRTCVKPAVEPALLMRRPLDGTVIDNVERWGTGALNGRGCSFAPGDPMWPGPGEDGDRSRPIGAGAIGTSYTQARVGVDSRVARGQTRSAPDPAGRQPANLLYCPKCSTAERERGTEGLPVRTAQECTGRDPESAGAGTAFAGAGRQSSGRRNHHPTVKPVALMRYLVRLVTPPGGVVLDPFMGSGACGIAASLEGFEYIGAELNPDYHAIAKSRIAHAVAYPEAWGDTVFGGVALSEREVLEALGQQGMFA